MQNDFGNNWTLQFIFSCLEFVVNRRYYSKLYFNEIFRNLHELDDVEYCVSIREGEGELVGIDG